VRLSEITTADQLVLTLARKQYCPVFDLAEADVFFLGEHAAAGVYAVGSVWYPHLGYWIRQIDVMPAVARNCGRGGLGVHLAVNVDSISDLNSVINACGHFLMECV
jgi:hypothetical protein